MQLKPMALGLATGIISAAAVFIGTLWSNAAGGGKVLSSLSRFFIGYSVSAGGAFVGLIWGFIYAFVGGLLLALLYNAFCKEKS